MVELDSIYTGPSIAKTEAQVPDKIVCEIIDQIGDSKDIKAITKAYVARSREDPELGDINAKTACMYAWNRVTSRIKTSSRRGRGLGKERAAKVATMAGKMVEAFKAVLVMELILPSGKRVREATFAECKAAGGLFHRLAGKGKPNQIVGKVLTDQQAQALWK